MTYVCHECGTTVYDGDTSMRNDEQVCPCVTEQIETEQVHEQVRARYKDLREKTA